MSDWIDIDRKFPFSIDDIDAKIFSKLKLFPEQTQIPQTQQKSFATIEEFLGNTIRNKNDFKDIQSDFKENRGKLSELVINTFKNKMEKIKTYHKTPFQIYEIFTNNYWVFYYRTPTLQSDDNSDNRHYYDIALDDLDFIKDHNNQINNYINLYADDKTILDIHKNSVIAFTKHQHMITYFNFAFYYDMSWDLLSERYWSNKVFDEFRERISKLQRAYNIWSNDTNSLSPVGDSMKILPCVFHVIKNLYAGIQDLFNKKPPTWTDADTWQINRIRSIINLANKHKDMIDDILPQDEQYKVKKLPTNNQYANNYQTIVYKSIGNLYLMFYKLHIVGVTDMDQGILRVKEMIEKIEGLFKNWKNLYTTYNRIDAILEKINGDTKLNFNLPYVVLKLLHDKQLKVKQLLETVNRKMTLSERSNEIIQKHNYGTEFRNVLILSLYLQDYEIHYLKITKPLRAIKEILMTLFNNPILSTIDFDINDMNVFEGTHYQFANEIAVLGDLYNKYCVFNKIKAVQLEIDIVADGKQGYRVLQWAKEVYNHLSQQLEFQRTSGFGVTLKIIGEIFDDGNVIRARSRFESIWDAYLRGNTSSFDLDSKKLLYNITQWHYDKDKTDVDLNKISSIRKYVLCFLIVKYVIPERQQQARDSSTLFGHLKDYVKTLFECLSQLDIYIDTNNPDNTDSDFAILLRKNLVAFPMLLTNNIVDPKSTQINNMGYAMIAISDRKMNDIMSHATDDSTRGLIILKLLQLRLYDAAIICVMNSPKKITFQKEEGITQFGKVLYAALWCYKVNKPPEILYVMKIFLENIMYNHSNQQFDISPLPNYSNINDIHWLTWQGINQQNMQLLSNSVQYRVSFELGNITRGSSRDFSVQFKMYAIDYTKKNQANAMEIDEEEGVGGPYNIPAITNPREEGGKKGNDDDDEQVNQLLTKSFPKKN